MGKARQVILGNSAAALSAIKAIREIDRSCPITVVSAEHCNAYSPVLTTYYLKGRIQKKDLFIVAGDFYEAMGVETIFGSKAIEVEPSKRTVHLEDGRKIEYGNLLIATGASPTGLDVPADGAANVFSLRTIEDAERIANNARTARDVVLIGAGLIALQIADALFKQGIKCTVLASSRQVLSQNIGADCAAIIQKEMESCGIPILFGRNVKEIRKQGKKAIVVSDSGEEWAADMVIVAKGVRPNMQLVQKSGIKTNRGILVDELMQTSIGGIFAAGDVSEGENLLTGKKEPLPTWTNACGQGRIAGLNMAGCLQRYEGGLRENITTIFGLTLAAIGLTKGSNDGLEELRSSDPERKSYRQIFLADNRVVGAVLLGKTADAGILASLVRNRRDVSRWKKGLARRPLDIKEIFDCGLKGPASGGIQCTDGWAQY